jgi:hypothetical protein
VCIALLIATLLQRARLDRYARPQVETIAANPTAVYDIKNKFDALSADVGPRNQNKKCRETGIAAVEVFVGPNR